MADKQYTLDELEKLKELMERERKELKKKLDKAKKKKKELKRIKHKLEKGPDRQISLTDPDARKMKSPNSCLVFMAEFMATKKRANLNRRDPH